MLDLKSPFIFLGIKFLYRYTVFLGSFQQYLKKIAVKIRQKENLDSKPFTYPFFEHQFWFNIYPRLTLPYSYIP